MRSCSYRRHDDGAVLLYLMVPVMYCCHMDYVILIFTMNTWNINNGFAPPQKKGIELNRAHVKFSLETHWANWMKWNNNKAPQGNETVASGKKISKFCIVFWCCEKRILCFPLLSLVCSITLNSIRISWQLIYFLLFDQIDGFPLRWPRCASLRGQFFNLDLKSHDRPNRY